MIEEWKDIEGFNGAYQISNFGRVKSVKRIVEYDNTNQTGQIFKGRKICPEKILKTFITRGYEHVSLRKGRKSTSFQIHRLVALYFVPNPNNYPIVNHKDENKLNNMANNLEWCTEKYNSNYGTRNKRIAEKLKLHPNYYIPVLCFDLNNNFICRYESAVEAGKAIGISEGGIIACCRLYKGRASAGGYKWKYEKDEDFDISTVEYKSQKKIVHKFSLDGEYICTYESLSEGACQMEKSIRNFSKAVHKGKAYGCLWIIGDNYEQIEELMNEIYEKEYHILQIGDDGEIINRFRSTLHANEVLGIVHSNICFATNAKTKEGKLFRKAGGFYWVNLKKDPNYEIDFNYKKGHGETRVAQYDLDGNLLRIFESIADAQEFIGKDRNKQSGIYDCVNPNKATKTAYGYIWKKI